MLYTTLKKIKQYRPCKNGWMRLLESLHKTQEDNDPLSMLHILNSNRFDDALWTLRTIPEYNELWRKYTIWSAKQSTACTKDKIYSDALEVAWNHIDGICTDEELNDAKTNVVDAFMRYINSYSLGIFLPSNELSESGAIVTAVWATNDSESAYWVASKLTCKDILEEKLRYIFEAGRWVE